MSKDILSQGEIDALLKTVEDTGGEHFSDTEKEALIELSNLGIESSVGAFAALTNREIESERPEIAVSRRSIVEKKIAPGAVCLTVLYEGAVTGQALMAMDGGLATVFCDILLGGDGSNPPADLNETQLGTLKEACQHGLDATADALGQALGEKLKLTVGAIKAATVQEEVTYFGDFDPDHVFVDLAGKLNLPDMVEGDVRYLYPAELSQALLKSLTARQGAETSEDAEADAPAPEAQPVKAKAPGGPAQRPASAQKATTRVVGGASRVQVQPATFEALKPSARNAESQNLDLILDVPLHLTVELGRTKMQVRQVLALGTGAVIELEKLAGEPLDVLVNGRLIAKGEVVIINENFGIRITDVISQVERVQNLR
ncbi:MAG TPA: flagellar motor switch phosphatase FliY [Bacillota bacterium]|jgi:flagellar motor switch protein FliN/FliY